jgi:hypothetical protein
LEKKIVSFIFALAVANNSFAQKPEDLKVIKVIKELEFVKAAFDEADYKVIAFDKYGNPHLEVIKSFTIFYKENNTAFENKVMGNVFPEKVINFLTKKKKLATKICLTKILAENSQGHLEELPDLCDIVIFPDCKSVKHQKK